MILLRILSEGEGSRSMPGRNNPEDNTGVI